MTQTKSDRIICWITATIFFLAWMCVGMIALVYTNSVLYTMIIDGVICAIFAWYITRDFITYEETKCKNCTIENWQSHHREAQLMHDGDYMVLTMGTPPNYTAQEDRGRGIPSDDEDKTCQ